MTTVRRHQRGAEAGVEPNHTLRDNGGSPERRPRTPCAAVSARTARPDPASRALRAGANGPELPAAHTLEYALIQAAGHGRRAVVEFLLDLQPDLTVTEPFFGATARGAARHQGHGEIAALIDARMSR